MGLDWVLEPNPIASLVLEQHSIQIAAESFESRKVLRELLEEGRQPSSISACSTLSQCEDAWMCHVCVCVCVSRQKGGQSGMKRGRC